MRIALAFVEALFPVAAWGQTLTPVNAGISWGPVIVALAVGLIFGGGIGYFVAKHPEQIAATWAKLRSKP